MTTVYWIVLAYALNGPQAPHALPARYTPTAAACQAALGSLGGRLPLDQGATCKPRVVPPPAYVYVVPGTAPSR